MMHSLYCTLSHLTTFNNIVNSLGTPLSGTRSLTNLAAVKKESVTPSFSCGLMNCQSACNMFAFLSNHIVEHNFDCVALTETWLSDIEENNKAVISGLVPVGYGIVHILRATRGGGVAFIRRKQCRVRIDKSLKFSSFECLTVLMDIMSFTFRFIVIYRPPLTDGTKKSTFIKEIGDLIEKTATLSGKLLLLGDFNVHVDNCRDRESAQLLALFEAFGLMQHVSGPTHFKGHTLDLVVSRATDDIVQSCTVGSYVSDHKCIHINLKAAKPHPVMKTISYRKTKAIDIEQFSSDIQASQIQHPSPENVDDMVSRYEKVLHELLDKHAPVRNSSVAIRPAQPWISPAILSVKRDRRAAERKWRRTGSTVHHQKFRECCEKVKDMVKKAKAEYYVNKIEECSGDQQKLFNIVDKLLGRGKDDALPQFNDARTIAQTFSNFFVTKISTIRTSLSALEETINNTKCPPIDCLLSSSSSKLQSFTPATVSEITEIVTKSSKATCSLDPVPTALLRDLLPVLAPVITDIVNESLSTGTFPSELKAAIVHPLIKKFGLDPEVLKNYRPVSNLCFISKVIEKVVASRLRDHLQANQLLDPMQSAYRAGHSTETALLRVHNDILSAVDKGHGVFLVLLDLSAAFDTVDHKILLDFLKDNIGLDGPVLQLIASYLQGRTQCVSVAGKTSEFTGLQYGVPQGSVLGPIMFCIYTTALGAILRYYKMGYHIYADDTQLYCTFDHSSPLEAINKIQICISDIRSWMIKNKLKINDDKTEFLVVTSKWSKFSHDINLLIGQETIAPSVACKSLGVMFDQHSNMDTQVKHVCRATHFHLRNIGIIRDLLTQKATDQLVHSLVTSRLDYCNSLLYGLPKKKTAPLQRVQNIAARIVTRTPTHDHMTPVLKGLHWLPVKSRILFKLLLMTYRAINNLAPIYLCDLVEPDVKERVLRSTYQHRLKPQDSRLISYGDRSFFVAAPKEWNKLPIDIKTAPTIDCFKTKLKTYLFKQFYSNATGSKN